MAGVRSGGCPALPSRPHLALLRALPPQALGLECTDLKTAFFSDTRDKPEEGEVTVGGDRTRFSSLRAASSHGMVCRKEASR